MGIFHFYLEQTFLCKLLQVVETLTLEPVNHAALLAAGLAHRLEKLYRDLLKDDDERWDGDGDGDGEGAVVAELLRLHITRVMVYLGLLELVGSYNRDGTHLLDMEGR